MRKIVLRQKIRQGGRLFELGSLKMDRSEVPIVYGFRVDTNNIIGAARDMRLNASTGEVTMELSFAPHYATMAETSETESLFDYTIIADRVEARGSAQLDTQVVSSCRLRAIALVPRSAMPKPGQPDKEKS